MDYAQFIVTKPRFYSWDLYHKNVLVRIDGNVPEKNGQIMDDFRLISVLPTLNFLKERGARIVLLSHRGRPHGFDQRFSNELLVAWFKEKGFSVFFNNSLIIPSYEQIAAQNVDIYLLENMRFFVGEKGNDPLLSKQLAACGDFYINDAWGVMHRSDSSITQLPDLFDKYYKSIGLLVEKELKLLQPLINPRSPFIVFAGGSKISSKAQALLSLITTQKINTLALLPPLVLPFLEKYKNKFEAETTIISLVQEIKKAAQMADVTLLYSLDFLIKRNTAFIECGLEEIQPYDEIIAVGQKTLAYYYPYIKSAQTLIMSGLMGFLEEPPTLSSFYSLLDMIARSSAYRVAAGGDTVSAVRDKKYEKYFDVLSTGGGATLSYVAGLPLPGLDALA